MKSWMCGNMKKRKIKSKIIGCKHAWGNPIPKDTEKYCSECNQTQGEGDCKTDIVVGERCYIYQKEVIK